MPFLVALGLPDATVLAYLVGLCEFVGGLAVVIGYPARLAAILRRTRSNTSTGWPPEIR